MYLFRIISRMSLVNIKAVLKCKARLLVSFSTLPYLSQTSTLWAICSSYYCVKKKASYHRCEVLLQKTDFTKKGYFTTLMFRINVTKKGYGFHQDSFLYTSNKAYALICIFYCLLISEYIFWRLISLNNKNDVNYLVQNVSSNQKTIKL